LEPAPDFLKQLWKRRVVQFGALYVGAAWLLLQVAVLIEETLELPNWVDQVTLLLLAIGFPVTLILAWAQDARVDEPATAPSSASSAPIVPPQDAPSVAVLPLRARESDEFEQLTAEGLTDDITTLPTAVKGIRVAPRPAVARALGPSDDPLQIADDLGCRYAFTGSVRRNGDKLRVSCELTDIANRAQAWSQRFDRDMEDIFAIQDEIAKGVVVAVGGVIARVEGARALRQRPDDLRAWELTRRAMTVAWDWRPETLAQALLDARKAVEFDPHYALAHGWLANILAFRAAAGWSDDVETERQEALREADETCRLGFDNGEALWPAHMAYWAAGSPDRSVQAHEATVSRQPDIFLPFPFALGSAGVAYARLGRVDEGLTLLRQVQRAFPNDEWGAVWARVFVGYAELCRRNYALVADVLTNSPSEHDGICRVIALMNSGRQDEAITDFRRWKTANPAIRLDHYIDYFKSYVHSDKSVGAELSDGLARLKDAMEAYRTPPTGRESCQSGQLFHLAAA
jgi:TolB-like protein